MTMMESLYNRCDDLLNPIIVKELRQVVRGKFFWGVLILFLGFQCAVLSMSIADRGLTSHNVGAETLTFLFGILFFASFVAIPIYNGFKFSNERNDGSDELLFITTITPETIVKGKFYAAMVFIFLIFSAFSPFMAMTFFLSGVDLPMTFLALVFALLLSAAGAMMQICFAALAHDAQSQKVWRGVGGMIQMMAFFSITGAGADMVQYGAARFVSYSQMGMVIVAFAFLTLSSMHFFYRASAALISPAGTNRMLPVRKSAFFIWLGSLCLAMWWAINSSSARYLIAWSGFVCTGLVVATMVAISERDSISERMNREIPPGLLKRRLAFFFYSGAAGGLAFVVLMTVLTLLAMNFFSFSGSLRYSGDVGEASAAVTAFMGYCLGYALIAAFIRRNFLGSFVDVGNSWVVMLVTTAAFAILPMFVWAVSGSNSELYLLGNPFMSLAPDKRPEGLIVGLAIALLAVAINLPWLKRQAQEFNRAGLQDE